MVGNLARGLGEIVVGLVRRLLVRIHRSCDDLARTLGEGAQVGDVLRVLGNRLGHDVLSTRKGLFGRVVTGLGRLGGNVCGGRVERSRAVLGRDLHDDHVGERLEPRLASLLRARLPLLAVGLVEVLDALELRGGANLGLELGRELALDVDEDDHILFALFEITQVGKAVAQGAKRDVVHTARGFLAIARDEGNRVALVDEVDGRLNGSRLEVQLLREREGDIHAMAPNHSMLE